MDLQPASESAAGQTLLKLLTRDGALAATFRPALSAEQYDELAARVNDFPSKPQLRQYLAEIAAGWDMSVVIDD